MKTNNENLLKQFEEKIKYTFKNKDLLQQAFTHRSYINENRGVKLGHNERLEFLGDAVLELVTTEYLYTKFPNRPEGDLTALRASLVNTQTLAKVGIDLDFNSYLFLSKGESKDVGRARNFILANTFESVTGALYLDGGYEVAKDFISKNVISQLDDIIEQGLWVDSKSKFQEKAQEVFGITPTYNTEKEQGPDHDKKFTVAVYLNEEKIAEGVGKSKQEAEQLAARNALKDKGWL